MRASRAISRDDALLVLAVLWKKIGEMKFVPEISARAFSRLSSAGGSLRAPSIARSKAVLTMSALARAALTMSALSRALLVTFFAIAPLFIAAKASAAPQVEIQSFARPERVTQGQRLTLEIRVDVIGGRIDRVELPSLDGFTILGHQKSSPVRFQFGLRGRSNVEASEIHTFTLRADQAGELRIDAPKAVVEGSTYEGTPLRVEVTAPAPSPTAPSPDPSSGSTLPSSPARPPPADQHSSAQSSDPNDLFDARVFIRTMVDRDEIYLGEQLTYTIELYTRINGSPRFSKEPGLDGFWLHELVDIDQPTEERREIVRGVPFRVYTLRRVAAFPLRTGELHIEAPILQMSLSSAFGLSRGETLERRGQRQTVRVKPLPSGVPNDALVGDFTIRSRVDRDRVKVGEAITYTVELEGYGNLSDLDLPIPDLPGLRVLAPERNLTITPRRGKVVSRLETRFLIIAEEPGRPTIPPLSLASFNPATESPKTLRTREIRLNIRDESGAMPPPSDAPPEHEPEAVEPIDPDASRLGSFRLRSELRMARRSLPEHPLFLLALALPPLTFAGALFARWFRRRRDEERELRDRARRHQQLLVEARERRRETDAAGLYAAIGGAIHAALDALLEKSTRGMTHRELSELLRERGLPRDLVERLIEELEGLDFARFSQSSAAVDEMDRALSRAESLLDRIDEFKELEKEKESS